LIPCQKTSYKSGLNLYRTSRLKGKKMLVSVYQAGSKVQTKDKFKFNVFVFKPAGYVKKQGVLKDILEVYNTFKKVGLYDLVQRISGGPEPKETTQEVEVAEPQQDTADNNAEEIIDADF